MLRFLAVLLGLCLLEAAFSQPWRQVYIVAIGEKTDNDLDLRSDLASLKEVTGLKPPIIVFNPSHKQILNLHPDSPILIVGHTTNDSYVMRKNESMDPTDAFDYKPTPPLHSGYKPGDMFMWGYPEPFPWVNITTPWHPATTVVEFLYPYRHQHLVILSTCYGFFFEHPAFPNVRGLYQKAVPNTSVPG